MKPNMGMKKVYIAEIAALEYDDTPRGARDTIETEGQISVKATPKKATNVVRLQDMQQQGRIFNEVMS